MIWWIFSLVLLLARRGTLSDYEFCNGARFTFHVTNGVICIWVRASFSLSNFFLHLDTYLALWLWRSSRVFGIWRGVCEHLKHMADYINLFLFPHILMASVISWEAESLRASSAHTILSDCYRMKALLFCSIWRRSWFNNYLLIVFAYWRLGFLGDLVGGTHLLASSHLEKHTNWVWEMVGSNAIYNAPWYLCSSDLKWTCTSLWSVIYPKPYL